MQSPENINHINLWFHLMCSLSCFKNLKADASRLRKNLENWQAQALSQCLKAQDTLQAMLLMLPAFPKTPLHWKKNTNPNQTNAKLPTYSGPAQGQNNVNADPTFTSEFFFSELGNTQCSSTPRSTYTNNECNFKNGFQLCAPGKGNMAS